MLSDFSVLLNSCLHYFGFLFCSNPGWVLWTLLGVCCAVQCCWPSLADGAVQDFCMEPSMSNRRLLGITGSERLGFPTDKTFV